MKFEGAARADSAILRSPPLGYEPPLALPERAAAFAPPLLLGLCILFFALDYYQILGPDVVFEPPLLLPILNTLFLSLVPFAVAYLAARSFGLSGLPGMLLAGSGALAFGAASLVAGWIISLPGGPNASVTVHNAGALLAGILHLLAAILTVSGIGSWKGLLRNWIVLGLAYASVLVVIAAISLAGGAGLLPVFYIQGVGPTFLRQAVLGSGVALFTFSSLLFVYFYARSRSRFIYWYALGLALLAVGLFTILLSPNVGGLLSWTGRLAQYLGCLSFLVALLALRRAAGTRGIPVAIAMADFFSRAETNYRDLMETTPDAIVTVDQEGRVLLWNSAAERLLGYPRTAAVGAMLSDLIGLRRQSGHLDYAREQAIREQGATSAAKLREAEVRDASGHPLPVEFSSAARRTVAGWMVTYVIRDIAERKQAEAALRESEERYSHLFNRMLDGFAVHRIITDQAGKPVDYIFLSVNAAFCQLTGLDRAAVIGRPVTQVLPGIERDPADWIGRYGRVALNGEEMRFEQFAQPLGRYYSVYAYSPEPGLFATVFEDVTARRQAEQERAQFLAQEQAARREAEAAVKIRDQFISIASHELRTPLTTLLGYAQLLRQRLEHREGVQPDERRMLGAIEQQTVRLNDMVTELLDIARLEQGQLTLHAEPVDLCALVSTALEDLRPSLQRHTLESELPGGSVMVQGDRGRLEQVLQNLLHNAIKYSPLGGPIAVRVWQDGQRACVAIRDYGIGIPAAAQPLLFSRFYRAPNAEARHINGLGIGLYIVREIVRLHGGEVSVESQEGVGSIFTVCFPAQL